MSTGDIVVRRGDENPVASLHTVVVDGKVALPLQRISGSAEDKYGTTGLGST